MGATNVLFLLKNNSIFYRKNKQHSDEIANDFFHYYYNTKWLIARLSIKDMFWDQLHLPMAHFNCCNCWLLQKIEQNNETQKKSGIYDMYFEIFISFVRNVYWECTWQSKQATNHRVSKEYVFLYAPMHSHLSAIDTYWYLRCGVWIWTCPTTEEQCSIFSLHLRNHFAIEKAKQCRHAQALRTSKIE